MLKKIYWAYCNYRNRKRWDKEINDMSPLVGLSHVAEFQPEVKILVIAPHADDELIGCHQLMVNNKNKVVVFYCGYLGSNQCESNRLTRESEFINYVNNIGVQYIVSSQRKVSEELGLVLRNYKPDVICLPSYIDWHREHRQINDICFSIIPKSAPETTVCWYHISIPIPKSFINSVSLMSLAQHSYKWDMMKTFYKSQLHMDTNRFQYVERIHGLANSYAETYCIMSVQEWCANLVKIHESGDFDILKQTLGDIKKMYTMSDSFYCQLL